MLLYCFYYIYLDVFRFRINKDCNIDDVCLFFIKLFIELNNMCFIDIEFMYCFVFKG